jgi:hypothetical protein
MLKAAKRKQAGLGKNAGVEVYAKREALQPSL